MLGGRSMVTLDGTDDFRTNCPMMSGPACRLLSLLISTELAGGRHHGHVLVGFMLAMFS